MPFNQYENWRFSTQNYLIQQGLWGFVDGTESQPSIHNLHEAGAMDLLKTWFLKNATALQAIKMTCGAEMLPHILHEEFAKVAWDKLGAANYAQPAGNNTGDGPANYAQPASSNSNDGPGNSSQPASNNENDGLANHAQPAENNTNDVPTNTAQLAGTNTGDVPAESAQPSENNTNDAPTNSAQPAGSSTGNEPANYAQPGNKSGGEPPNFVQSGNNIENELSNCAQPEKSTGGEPANNAQPGNGEPANHTQLGNNTRDEPANHSQPGNNTGYVPANEPQPGDATNNVAANDSQTVNNANNVPAVVEHMDEENSYTRHVALFKAINKNDLETAKEYLRDNPSAATARMTSSGETALHMATEIGRLNLVKELLRLMPREALETKSDDGAAAISYNAQEGSVEIAKLMIEKNNNVLRIRNANGYIPLVLAAIFGNEGLMRYLYSLTPKEELDPEVSKNGAALLTATIMADIYDVALEVLQRYPKLATAKDPEGGNLLNTLSTKTSAFPSGNRHGFLQQFIYTHIPVELDYWYRDVDTSGHSIQINSEASVQKISKVKQHGIVWKALTLLVPGVKKIHEKKVRHVQALELLRVICLQISSFNVEQLTEAQAYSAIIRTAMLGIIEYFKELINSCPHLMYCLDSKDRVGLFQIAVLHRQDKIYNFMAQTGNRYSRAHVVSTVSGNNMLHLAGFLAPPTQLDKVSGAALQMQREIQWFQEVEKMVQPKYKDLYNNDQQKPRDVFRKEHKALVKEGEAWMKETSQACMVVSTLIATVMFAAAFTVPGGNNQDTGFPIFLKHKSFYVFIISDAIALFASCTSVLMFFAILTARYAEQDFLRSLPQKLILGLASLFISIAAMMTAFGATLVIVLQGSVPWAYIPVTLLASVPVLLFGFLQFPLFVDIVLSTYGPGIFHKPKDNKKEN